VSRLICVKKRAVRHKLPQTFDQGAFTGGNSAGYSNCSHEANIIEA
jgi:hypothetical protein